MVVRKVVDYKVLAYDGQSELGESVVKYLKDGWELQGGVSLSVGRYTNGFAQAMVKYETCN